jgi:hypothetical protein
VVNGGCEMKTKTSIGATAAVVVTAFASAGSWVWWKSHTPNAQAREWVRAQLKEPGKVGFDALRQNPTSKAVCGVLQTRDNTGHFVRSGSFVALADGQVWLEPAPSAEQSLAKPESLSGQDKHVFIQLKAEHCPELS